MKSHKTLIDLYDYKMNRLDESNRKKIEEHLNQCSKCKKELEELEKTLGVLSKWKVPEFPDELDERILSRIREYRKSALEKLKDSLFRPFFPKLAWSAVGLAAIIFLAIIVYRSAFMPGIDQTTREIPVTTQEENGAKKPIIVEAENMDSAFARLVEIIQSYDGKLIRRRMTEKEIEITFYIKKEAEERIFEDIRQVGKVIKEKEGYKDGEGNIVLFIKHLKIQQRKSF